MMTPNAENKSGYVEDCLSCGNIINLYRKHGSQAQFWQVDYDYDPEPSFSLFEVSAPFVRKFLYLSLGILGLLIIIGIVWEACKRRSTDAKEKMELVSVCVEKLDEAKGIEREAMRGNIEETKQLLQEVQEQLVKLESSVLQVFEKLDSEELEDKKQINDRRS